jgi:protein phosphatase
MRFLPGNAQHIGARHSQQDSFGFADPDDADFIRHGGFLAVVCDGMGGMEHGDLAGRTAVRTFLEAYGRKTQAEAVPAALDRAVREANARVVALAHSLGRAEGVGTTIVAATLLDGGPGQARLYWVSVGDSGLFHVSGGQLRMVNHPHVFANQLDQAVARGTLSYEAAMTHPERESLTSFIGAEVLEEIDLTTEPLILAEGDTILLASDGMFKTLSPGEMMACFDGNPQSWPDTLVEQTLARQRESQDNVTVLSVTVEDEPVSAMQPSGAYVQPDGATTVRLPSVEVPTSPVLGAPPPPIPPPLTAPASGKGRNWIWALGLILLIGAGGGGWWYWSHRTPSGSAIRPADPPVNQGPPSSPQLDPDRPLPPRDPNGPAEPPFPAAAPGGGK